MLFIIAKYRDVVYTHPKHRDNRRVLGLPLPDKPFKDPSSLLTFQRGKQKEVAPQCLLVPIT
jgi:hypothetical protein